MWIYFVKIFNCMQHKTRKLIITSMEENFIDCYRFNLIYLLDSFKLNICWYKYSWHLSWDRYLHKATHGKKSISIVTLWKRKECLKVPNYFPFFKASALYKILQKNSRTCRKRSQVHLMHILKVFYITCFTQLVSSLKKSLNSHISMCSIASYLLPITSY